MPSKKFTAAWVKSLEASAQREEWFDYSRLATGQALVLRNNKRTKTWACSYYLNGKTAKLIVGRYDRQGDGVNTFTLSQADEAAQRKLKALLDKKDPAKVIRTEKELEQERGHEKNSFEAVAELFLLRYCPKLADHGKRYREIIERDFIPAWKGRPAKDIKRGDVVAVLDSINLRGGVAANRALATIRKWGNWSTRRDLLEYNPAAQVDPPGGKESSRDRVLDKAEIKTVWNGIDGATMAPGLKLLLKLVLVTGQRSQELRMANKSEFDLDGNLWTIPAAHTKNRKTDHLVPLSPLAVKLIREAVQLYPDSGYMFPSPRTGKPFDINALPRAVRNNRSLFPIPDWSPHDLRRSASTHMRRIGIPRDTLKAILNHADGSITAVYDRYDRLKEKKTALNKWARELQGVVK